MKVTKEEIVDIIRKAIRDEKRRNKKEKVLNDDEGSNPVEVNSNHKSDGTFSSEKDATCDSRYFSGGKRKRKSGFSY